MLHTLVCQIIFVCNHIAAATAPAEPTTVTPTPSLTTLGVPISVLALSPSATNLNLASLPSVLPDQPPTLFDFCLQKP